VFVSEQALREALSSSLQKSLAAASADLQAEVLPAFKHVLTHKDLHCHVLKLIVKKGVPVEAEGAWWAVKDWTDLGLPQPIRHLLSSSL
jgi:A/G-specific adenine glycosylase